MNNLNIFQAPTGESEDNVNIFQAPTDESEEIEYTVDSIDGKSFVVNLYELT